MQMNRPPGTSTRRASAEHRIHCPMALEVLEEVAREADVDASRRDAFYLIRSRQSKVDVRGELTRNGRVHIDRQFSGCSDMSNELAVAARHVQYRGVVLDKALEVVPAQHLPDRIFRRALAFGETYLALKLVELSVRHFRDRFSCAIR